jgi:glycosyltransferase involved in cell wall biosynthesis
VKEKVPVSVIIPTLNEEKNLRRAIESILWADEIFVVDSQSTDRTIEIAEELGAKVIQFSFNGIWPKKKNWALENLPYKHEWVFILDADEEMPESAKDEFLKICSNPDEKKSGYFINRRFMFMGTWLKHAYYPNWNLRLFKHRLGRYEQLTNENTHSGDNEVHEHVIVSGSTGQLKSEMLHYAFPTTDVFIEKHNRYANWEAVVKLSPSSKNSAEKLQSPKVRLRRVLKTVAQYLPCKPFLRFFYVFIVQGGFLDGKEGYYFAKLHGVYQLLIDCKVHEKKKESLS